MQTRTHKNCIRILVGIIVAMITTLIGYISTTDIKDKQIKNDIIISLPIIGFFLGILIKILQEKCISELSDGSNDVVKKTDAERKSILSERLNAINYDQKSLPESFTDPIDFQLMDNPVMLKTKRGFSIQRYDNEIAKRLTICPFSREHILGIKTDKQLKKDILNFIYQEERNFNQKKNHVIDIEEKAHHKNHHHLHIWKPPLSGNNSPERDQDVSEKSPLIYKKIIK